MIKLVRNTVVVLFVVSLVIFAMQIGMRLFSGKAEPPVISCMQERLEVSVHATEEELKAGLVAYSDKDGNITDRIIIESISDFVSEGEVTVSYAVFDSNNQVGRYTRKVVYTDYASPRFTLSQDMHFTENTTFNVLNYLGAEDMLDGDISGSIKLTGSGLSEASAGTYSMVASVTNSRGDTSYLEFDVVIEEKNIRAPEITLNQYLVYTEIGEELDLESYIEGAAAYDGTVLETDQIEIVSGINYNKEGCYGVLYQLTTEAGDSAEATLVVVVQPGKENSEE